MKSAKIIAAISLTTVLIFFFSSDASAQKFKKKKPETLYARNKKKNASPIYVGIGTKDPSAQLHTVGTVRMEGLIANNSLNTLVAVDGNGNLFWRDISNTIANAWFLNGNTIGSSNFLGTTNSEDLRIRTNNIQRAIITSNGSLGLGITVPTAQLHTTGTIRFDGLINNDAASRLVSMDNNGNLSWRDATSVVGSTAWLLNGNNATASNFFGTTSNEDLRIRTNNIQRAVVTNAGSFGLGVAAPSAQLHTNGTVRLEGVANNNTLQRLALFDNTGNLFYRDLTSLQSNFWSLTGNTGTNPATNFLGTADNNRLVFRTNNTEKMTILSNGKIGIGVANPQVILHASSNTGAITAFPYEAAVFEKNGDSKISVLSSDNTGIGGAAITLAHSNFLVGGLYPGYEMQYGVNNGRYLRFNYVPRDANGAIQNEVANIMILSDNSRVGVNLGPTVGGTTPNYPTANFHTNGTVRFQGLQNGTGNPLLADANGNVFIGTGGVSNAWNLTGNSGTNPATNFLGTTDNNRLVLRTNNAERMTVLGTNGFVGIGVVNPQVRLHVSNGQGTMTGFPYETAVIENNGDAKFSVVSSDNSGLGGASVILGHSNFTVGGLYPGYEMQFGVNNGRYLRFNYLQRNASGVIQSDVSNILILSDNSRVGVNLGPTGGGTTPNYPTANFHTSGTVRFQNLPNGTGSALVMDANGNVFKSSTLVGRATEGVSELKDEIQDLKKEIEALKLIVNSMKEGTLTINENKNAAILYQNAPNPFKSTTIVKYYLPAGTQESTLRINDLQGNILKTYKLNGGGEQSIIINGGELSAGTYFYILYVNGREVDSKKMILTR